MKKAYRQKGTVEEDKTKMKKYLLVNEYEYRYRDRDNEEFRHKQYLIVNAKNPKEAVSKQDGLFKVDKRYDRLADIIVLKRDVVDIREMVGDETVGDNLIYSI